MKYILSILIPFLLLNTVIVFGQYEIKGYAPNFVGEKVELYTYQDYVTMSRIKLGEATVSKADSLFRIPLKVNTTVKGIISIDGQEAEMYVAPETSYDIYFPPSKDPPSYKNRITNIYFSSLDSTDINYRVLQYHQWFDTFIAYNDTAIARGGFLSYLDTFKTYVADAYEDVEDVYFITYVRYDIAEMEQTFGGNKKSERRLNTYLEYIEPFPVYYENDRYMKFILAFYAKEFRDYLPSTEKEILMAISNSSPTQLMRTLRRDIFLAKPELRELIMVDKLGKAFYREIELQNQIIFLLDSVANYSNSPLNRTVADNVKNYITNLEPGYPAPPIKLEVGDEESVTTWADYKGKYVYFNFFATWSETALKDMKVMDELYTKYGEDIEFVSVCTDEDSASYKQFLEEHPGYDWDIFYIGEGHPLQQSFRATSVPAYYLIDQEGFIAGAPALSPSPNGKYESIEKTLFSIKVALHPELRKEFGRN